MYERIITGLLLVVAFIHLLPLVGALGSGQLASLYGVEITDQNLEILMRHRAILFAIPGGVAGLRCIYPGYSAHCIAGRVYQCRVSVLCRF